MISLVGLVQAMYLIEQYIILFRKTNMTLGHYIRILSWRPPRPSSNNFNLLELCRLSGGFERASMPRKVEIEPRIAGHLGGDVVFAGGHWDAVVCRLFHVLGRPRPRRRSCRGHGDIAERRRRQWRQGYRSGVARRHRHRGDDNQGNFDRRRTGSKNFTSCSCHAGARWDRAKSSLSPTTKAT